MFRMVGGTFGVAALGALFQSEAKGRLATTLGGQNGLTEAQRSDFAHQLTGGVPQIDGVSQAKADRLVAAGQDAFIYGLSHAMKLSVAIAASGVVIAFLMLGGKSEAIDEDTREAAEIAEAASPVA